MNNDRPAFLLRPGAAEECRRGGRALPVEKTNTSGVGPHAEVAIPNHFLVFSMTTPSLPVRRLRDLPTAVPLTAALTGYSPFHDAFTMSVFDKIRQGLVWHVEIPLARLMRFDPTDPARFLREEEDLPSLSMVGSVGPQRLPPWSQTNVRFTSFYGFTPALVLRLVAGGKPELQYEVALSLPTLDAYLATMGAPARRWAVSTDTDKPAAALPALPEPATAAAPLPTKPASATAVAAPASGAPVAAPAPTKPATLAPPPAKKTITLPDTFQLYTSTKPATVAAKATPGPSFVPNMAVAVPLPPKVPSPMLESPVAVPMVPVAPVSRPVFDIPVVVPDANPAVLLELAGLTAPVVDHAAPKAVKRSQSATCVYVSHNDAVCGQPSVHHNPQSSFCDAHRCRVCANPDGSGLLRMMTAKRKMCSLCDLATREQNKKRAREAGIVVDVATPEEPVTKKAKVVTQCQWFDAKKKQCTNPAEAMTVRRPVCFEHLCGKCDDNGRRALKNGNMAHCSYCLKRLAVPRVPRQGGEVTPDEEDEEEEAIWCIEAETHSL